MSCVRCDRCAYLIDSDDDPECFTQEGNGPILCENCRDDAEEIAGLGAGPLEPEGPTRHDEDVHMLDFYFRTGTVPTVFMTREQFLKRWPLVKK